MGKELFMALDLGTSFIKAGVYDLEGNLIALAKEPVKDERPEVGVFIQKGEDLFQSVVNCMKQVCALLEEKTKDIAAISFTGQMAGFMGVGEDWSDITSWSCSLDTRYGKYASAQLEKLKDDFLRISATTSPLFSAKYEWFKTEFPNEAEKIRKYLMLNGYILGKLGDGPVSEATIDGSLLTWTGLADIKERCWSDEIGEKLGVNPSHLPKIVDSYQVVSHLTKEIAALLGMKENIPLVAGAGDKIAGCVGAAILQPGDMIFEAGSFGGLSAFVTEYKPDFEAEHYDILNGCKAGDLYAHYYIPGSGITLDWFINQFARKEGENLGTAFQNLNDKMEQLEPGCEGLMAIGMLSGTVMPFDGDLKGVWMGFDWSHKPEHFFRALIESHAYALSTAMDQIAKNYPEYPWNRVVMIGGGAKSNAQTQIFADVCGKEFVTIDREDAALWGTCILAAKGIGLVEDIGKFALEHITTKQVFTPNQENHEKYKKLKKQYQKYEKELSPYCRDLVKE